MIVLDMEQVPKYHSSGYKYFRPGEKHVTRICTEDVLVMVFDGTLRFREDGQDVTVMSGDYYIQRAGLLQEGIADSTAQYYYVHFYGAYREDGHGLPLRGQADFSKLRPLFTALECRLDPHITRTEVTGAFCSLLSALKQTAAMTRRQKVARDAVSYLEAHLQDNLTLDTLSGRFGYSKNQFIHIFRQETGKTPYDCLLELRLEAAKHMLVYSDLPVGQISEECGFGSYVNLYKAFVCQQDCAPAEWRKKQRNLGDTPNKARRIYKRRDTPWQRAGMFPFI